MLAVQWLAQAAFGAPLIGTAQAEHVLDSLTLLGPTALFAAFTGVLLFASSLIAGWVENWFVWHRLDSAIAWNPRIVARLGAARAQRWAAYWRANISGFAANISLGMLLGVVPVVALFFGLPIEVRHVTLSTGQLAAAVGTEGFGLLRHGAFWWCVAGIAVTGALNLSVSFFLAFRVALRSRGIRLADRSRIYRAIRARLWHKPLSFIWPSDPPSTTWAVNRPNAGRPRIGARARLGGGRETSSTRRSGSSSTIAPNASSRMTHMLKRPSGPGDRAAAALAGLAPAAILGLLSACSKPAAATAGRAQARGERARPPAPMAEGHDHAQRVRAGCRCAGPNCRAGTPTAAPSSGPRCCAAASGPRQAGRTSARRPAAPRCPAFSDDGARLAAAAPAALPRRSRSKARPRA